MGCTGWSRSAHAGITVMTAITLITAVWGLGANDELIRDSLRYLE